MVEGKIPINSIDDLGLDSLSGLIVGDIFVDSRGLIDLEVDDLGLIVAMSGSTSSMSEIIAVLWWWVGSARGSLGSRTVSCPCLVGSFSDGSVFHFGEVPSIVSFSLKV